MHRILTASALLLPLFFAPTVFGQASLGFDIGYNNGIHSHLEDRDWVVDSEVKPVFSVSLFNGHFGEEGRNLRYGLHYTHQLVRTIPREGAGYATRWRSSIFQLETERLIAEGSTNREIAGTLYIAEGTVKNHVTNILGKLGVRDRTQAALKAREMGLI